MQKANGEVTQRQEKLPSLELEKQKERVGV